MSIVEQGNEDLGLAQDGATGDGTAPFLEKVEDAAGVDGGAIDADPGDGEIEAALAQIRDILAKLDEINRLAAENKAAADGHAQTLGTLNERVAGLQELGAALTEDIFWIRDRHGLRWLDGRPLPASRIEAVYKQIKAVRSQADRPDATVVAMTRLVKRWLVPTIAIAATAIVLAVAL